MKQLYKIIILFLIGGLSYYGIELVWRGYSHWTMLCLGGVCFGEIGFINEVLKWKTPLWKQCGIATFIVLLSELIAGYLLNIKLNLGIWDYSTEPFNYMGQICLKYAILWYFLSAIAIILDDLLRYKLWQEPIYKYKLF